MWERGEELGLSGEVAAQEPESRVKWGISRARGKARGEGERGDGIRTGISLCPESARPSAGLRAVRGGRATLGVGNRESREAISLGVCVAGGWRGTQGGGARVGVGRSGAGGPLVGGGRTLTAASPAQASPPASPPAGKAEHCELVHFAVNFPLLRKTLSHPRERPHPARPGALGSGSRGAMARGAADAGVQAGAARGPLYGGPNSGEGAARRAIGLLIRGAERRGRRFMGRDHN